MKLRPKLLTITQQAVGLKGLYPGGACTAHRNKLVWLGEITPTPLSCTYKIKLAYEFKKTPKIYVVEPKLVLPKGRKRPHLYSDSRLCLYYPGQWQPWMCLAKTVIPWASEWFVYYEIWLATGEWQGGGIHPVSNKKDGEN